MTYGVEADVLRIGLGEVGDKRSGGSKRSESTRLDDDGDDGSEIRAVYTAGRLAINRPDTVRDED